MTTAASHSVDAQVRSQLRIRLASEHGLAIVALVVVALHVVDDNFVQPQPGTSAADHLVSGLVPLALLVLLPWHIRVCAVDSVAPWRSFSGCSQRSWEPVKPAITR